MTQIVVTTSSSGCKKISANNNTSGTAAPPPTPSKDGIAVVQSVGLRSSNLPPDVERIQDALNRVAPSEGRATPPLKIDGLCGSKTTTAIQQFQLKQFGWSGADGKINPNGQTITRLNKLLAASALLDAAGQPAIGDTANQIFRQAMTGGIVRAGQMVRAALNEIDRAFPVIESKDEVFPTRHSRADKVRRLNRYFRIDEFQRGGKSLWLQYIRRIFVTMQLVIDRPGGPWGAKGFDIDSSGQFRSQAIIPIAWTTGGGFFREDEPLPPPAEMFRANSIYFVLDNVIWLANIDYAGYAIVHELAHFCGNTESIGLTIEDFNAYGEPETPAVYVLQPLQRVHHADSYARFAGACFDDR